jgi:hypothetical protein
VSQASDVLVLRLEGVGGFVSPQSIVGRVPQLSVYGDGRVISEGPMPADYPGPALPNIQVRRISVDSVQRLVDLAVAAGVGQTRDYGQPSVADVGSTRVTVRTGGSNLVTDVYALDFSEGLTAMQRSNRAVVKGLVDRLSDLPGTLGAANVGPEEQYQPTAIAAFATIDDMHDPTMATQPERAWPGPALPGTADRFGLSCLVAIGSDATQVISAATEANQATPWTFEGKRWSVTFRPLLPDEHSCADLGG